MDVWNASAEKWVCACCKGKTYRPTQEPSCWKRLQKKRGGGRDAEEIVDAYASLLDKQQLRLMWLPVLTFEASRYGNSKSKK